MHFHEDQVSENKLVFREARKQYIQLPHRNITEQFCRQFQSCCIISLGICQGTKFVQLNIWPLSWPTKASGWSQVLLLLIKNKRGIEGNHDKQRLVYSLWPKAIQKITLKVTSNHSMEMSCKICPQIFFIHFSKSITISAYMHSSMTIVIL